MRRNTFRFVELLLLIAAVAGVIDCRQGSQGVQGNLLFFDLTREPGDPLNLAQEMDRPVAEGAFVDIEVKDNHRLEAVITSASSSNEAVLEVSTTLRNVVQLEAVGDGTALLDVTAAGLTDSIALAVSPIATTELEILPWGESTLLPESVYAGGVVLTPETNTSLYLRHRDSDNDILTGYGALSLSVEPTGATLTPTAGSDFYTLRAMDTTGTITLTATGVNQEIEVVELAAITDITLNDVSNNGLIVPSSFSVPVGSRWYTVGAYTDDDRYVIAPFSDTFEVEIEEDSQDLMEFVEVTSQEGQDLLDDARAFFLDFQVMGTANFTVRWLEFELAFTVLITPEDTE